MNQISYLILGMVLGAIVMSYVGKPPVVQKPVVVVQESVLQEQNTLLVSDLIKIGGEIDGTIRDLDYISMFYFPGDYWDVEIIVDDKKFRFGANSDNIYEAWSEAYKDVMRFQGCFKGAE